uniref:tRNA wybutosine-synthesizing protein 3 homolog n=1 Tax=Equus caballus TaxID=9796 RepID=A0A9L0RGN3_HORSE
MGTFPTTYLVLEWGIKICEASPDSTEKRGGPGPLHRLLAPPRPAPRRRRETLPSSERRGIDGFEVQKQNCCWLLVTHKPCVKDDVIVALKKANSDAILKFEPFILHVQCRQLQDAQILHSVAIDSGFRNSGITVGKRGKTMLAVRSTHGLEVPLSHKGQLMVTEEYIDFLLKIANQKMEENKKRIERFYSCLQHALEREAITNSHPREKIRGEENSSYSPKKKRNPEKARGKCITEENDKELENDDDDDPGISVPFFPEDY